MGEVRLCSGDDPGQKKETLCKSFPPQKEETVHCHTVYDEENLSNVGWKRAQEIGNAGFLEGERSGHLEKRKKLRRSRTLDLARSIQRERKSSRKPEKPGRRRAELKPFTRVVFFDHGKKGKVIAGRGDRCRPHRRENLEPNENGGEERKI